MGIALNLPRQRGARAPTAPTDETALQLGKELAEAL
jgi:hypothetical protein